jgi:integrase
MPVKRLTEEGIARLKAPEGKQLDYRDAVLPGLILRVNYAGTKVWRAAHRKVGKSGKTYESAVKIGRWPHLGVKEARDKARLFLADPAKATEGTFAEVMELFLERHVRAQGLRTAAAIERLLRVNVLPHWGLRPFTSIRRVDVAALLDRVEDERGKRMADLTLAHVRSMMNFYAKRSDDYVSPIVRGMGRRNGDHRRARILSDDEIRALWKVAPAVGGYGDLCKCLLLTGSRRSKLETMQHQDVVNGTWVIATEKREKGNPGTLVLPPMVRRILAAQPVIRGDARVFSTTGFKDHRKAELDRLLKAELGDLPRWTLHDLRRTCRSLLSRAGVAPHIGERVLGHSLRGVGGVYDRHAYTDEKAAALKALAGLVAGIVGEAPRKAAGALRRRGGSR